MMLIQAIDQFLEERPKKPRRRKCFHPSSLHKSAKYLYHAYLNGDNTEDFEPRVKRIFDTGHALQGILDEYLRGAGVLVDTEVAAEDPELEIMGHADGIIKLGKLKGVLEVKTMNISNFSTAYEPRDEHLIQINTYMHCLDTPRGALLYWCKDDCRLKEFFVKLDQAILDPVFEKIRYVQRCIRDGVEPA
jgi:hypothetical protein